MSTADGVRPGPRPDTRLSRRPGDGWVECGCGHRHWGLGGAAGLMVWRERDGEVDVVLQHRALWSHFGGTWGLPGGAIADGETPVEGAVREAVEEAALDPAALEVRAWRALVHPDWAYTTVLAEAVGPLEPAVSDPESLEIAWVPLADVAAAARGDAGTRELLPAFADALPELATMVRRLVLVVDGANVVGSRPDGWWADRAGAAVALRDHLAELARTGLPADVVGLPGATWLPRVVLVTEGRARGVGAVPGVEVRAAPGSGDEEIVDTVADLATGRNHVVVATADRELRGRVGRLGAGVVGPRLVRH